MFEEFNGIPAHALLVHAAVVFLPLQVLAGLAYGLVPMFRRSIAWFVLGSAVVAPGAAFMAKLSGEALRERFIRNGVSDPGVLANIQRHNDFGNLALYSSLGLGVVMILLVLLNRARAGQAGGSDGAGGSDDGGPGGLARLGGTGSTVVTVILTVALLGAAGATGYYVFQTGDLGAKMAWTGK